MYISYTLDIEEQQPLYIFGSRQFITYADQISGRIILNIIAGMEKFCPCKMPDMVSMVIIDPRLAFARAALPPYLSEKERCQAGSSDLRSEPEPPPALCMNRLKVS